MIWNLIGSIGGKVLDIVDDLVEDKDEANCLKFEIQRQLIENKSNELENATNISPSGSSRQSLVLFSVDHVAKHDLKYPDHNQPNYHGKLRLM